MKITTLAKTLDTVAKEFPYAFVNRDWTFIALCVLRRGFLEKALSKKISILLCKSVTKVNRN